MMRNLIILIGTSVSLTTWEMNTAYKFIPTAVFGMTTNVIVYSTTCVRKVRTSSAYCKTLFPNWTWKNKQINYEQYNFKKKKTNKTKQNKTKKKTKQNKIKHNKTKTKNKPNKKQNKTKQKQNKQKKKKKRKSINFIGIGWFSIILFSVNNSYLFKS